VINHTHEPAHRYVVDLEPASCTCEDWHYRRDNSPEVCKHFQAAHEAAPATHDLDHRAALQVLQHYHDGAQAASDGATDDEVQAAVDQQEAAASDDSGATADSGDQPPAVDQEDVETVRDWLETAGAAMEHLEIDIGTHGTVNGIRINPDNRAMPDSQYEAFKGIVGTIESSEVHVGFGDDPCHACNQDDGEFWYFVPSSGIDEVPG